MSRPEFDAYENKICSWAAGLELTGVLDLLIFSCRGVPLGVEGRRGDCCDNVGEIALVV